MVAVDAMFFATCALAALLDRYSVLSKIVMPPTNLQKVKRRRIYYFVVYNIFGLEYKMNLSTS